jgi:hypothetical protein
MIFASPFFLFQPITFMLLVTLRDPLTCLFHGTLRGTVTRGSEASFGVTLDGLTHQLDHVGPTWLLDGDRHMGPHWFTIRYVEGNESADQIQHRQDHVLVFPGSDFLVTPCGPWDGPPAVPSLEAIGRRQPDAVEISLPYQRFAVTPAVVNAVSGTFIFTVEVMAHQDVRQDTMSFIRSLPRQSFQDFRSSPLTTPRRSTWNIVLDTMAGRQRGDNTTWLLSSLLGIRGAILRDGMFHSFEDSSHVFESSWDGVRRALFWNPSRPQEPYQFSPMTILIPPSHRAYSFRLLIAAWRHVFENPGFRISTLRLALDYDWSGGIHHRNDIPTDLAAWFKASAAYARRLVRCLQHAARFGVGFSLSRVTHQLIVELPHWRSSSIRRFLISLLCKGPIIPEVRLRFARGRTPLELLALVFNTINQRYRPRSVQWLPLELSIDHFADISDETDYDALQSAIEVFISPWYRRVRISFPNSRLALPARWAADLDGSLRLLRYTFSDRVKRFLDNAVNLVPDDDGEISSSASIQGAFGIDDRGGSVYIPNRRRYRRDEATPSEDEEDDARIGMLPWERRLRHNAYVPSSIPRGDVHLLQIFVGCL